MTVQGPYSPTILKDILCLFLQDLQIGMSHQPYSLANQKLCYIQMLPKIEKFGE